MANTRFNIKRLEEDIRRELSAAVGGVKDPRVADGLVTVTRCELTNDMSYCKVGVACMGGESRTAKAVEFLKEFCNDSQGILFTCHNSICEIAKERGIEIRQPYNR